MRHAILHLKKADPVLAGIIQRIGPYRIEFRDPAFSTLVRSIVYQQLSGRVALRIFERLLDLLPERQLTPEAVLALTVEQMRACGLSGQKTCGTAFRTLAVRGDHPKTFPWSVMLIRLSSTEMNCRRSQKPCDVL